MKSTSRHLYGKMASVRMGDNRIFGIMQNMLHEEARYSRMCTTSIVSEGSVQRGYRMRTGQRGHPTVGSILHVLI
jgi:hypothetical protein